MSFFDDKIRVDFVLFGSIVVSAKINEFPMMGAIASVGFNERKKNEINILTSNSFGLNNFTKKEEVFLMLNF